MKKLAVIPLIAFIVLSLSSCIVPVDLRDRAIVQIMGIDFENFRYKITLQEYTSQGKEDSEDSGEAIVVESFGKTLYDALKNAETKDGKQVFYGQCRIFVIGKNALNKGIEEICDFFSSNYELSLNSSVFAADDSAEKILKTKIFSGTNPSISVSRLEDSGKTVDIRVLDVLKFYNHKGAGVLPVISKTDKENLVIEKAVILKDYKQRFLLNDEQTLGLNFIRSKISDAVITTEIEDKTISVALVSQRTKKKLKKEGKKFILSVNVSAEGNISENIIINKNTIEEELLNTVEISVSEQIEECVQIALEKIINTERCDLFFLLPQLKKLDKTTYKNAKQSDEWLSMIEVDVNADFKVRHSGI